MAKKLRVENSEASETSMKHLLDRWFSKPYFDLHEGLLCVQSDPPHCLLGPMRALLLAIALILATISSPAGTLTTTSYMITVEMHCPEGCVTCDDVRYV